MAKYDVEFKKKCIKAYQEKKELPKVDGVMSKSMVRYVREWLMLFKEQGEKGLTNDIIYQNYSLKDKINAVKRINKGETYGHNLADESKGLLP